MANNKKHKKRNTKKKGKKKGVVEHLKVFFLGPNKKKGGKRKVVIIRNAGNVQDKTGARKKGKMILTAAGAAFGGIWPEIPIELEPKELYDFVVDVGPELVPEAIEMILDKEKEGKLRLEPGIPLYVGPICEKCEKAFMKPVAPDTDQCPVCGYEVNILETELHRLIKNAKSRSC